MQVIKQEVREAILDSAKKEFSRKGYAAASVRTIAANARTSVGNLYKYYSGKEELFLALVLPVTGECIDMVSRTFDTANGRLQSMASYMAGYVSGNREVFGILTGGPAEHYSAFLDSFTSCISGRLRECMLRDAPGLAAKIRNPAFFDAVASAYVGGLRPIIENFADVGTMTAYISELMKFLFDDFIERLSAQ